MLSAGGPGKLAFPLKPPSVEPCVVYGPIAIQTQDLLGNRVVLQADVRLVLSTNSPTGDFGVSASAAFDGSQHGIPLPRGASEAFFFYKDCTVGTPELTVHEEPSQGLQWATETRLIALKRLVVNNSGQIDSTKVSIGTWQNEQAILSLSHDGVVTLALDVTTRAVAADGSHVDLVTVDRMQDPPPPPEGNVIPVALRLGPTGATFNPPLLLSINYTKVKLPPDTDVDKLRIHLLVDGHWQPIDSTVDRSQGTIYATIQHFSDYAIIAPVRQTHWLLFGLGGIGLFGLLLVYSRRWSLIVLAADAPVGVGPWKLTLQARNFRGRPFRPGADLRVRLTASSATSRLDAAADGLFAGRDITLVLPSGTGEQTFYCVDTAPGAVVFKAQTDYRLSKWVRSRWPARSKSTIDLRSPEASNTGGA